MRKTLNLTLFLRHMGSLRTWEDSGVLSREMEMYRALQEHNVRVSIISHGGRDERAFRDQLPGMMILPNLMELPGPVYERRAHVIHARRLLQSDVLITADSTAIVSALRANWAWRIPLVYRMDYHWSALARANNPQATLMINNIIGLEKKGIAAAAQVMASAPEIAEYVVQQAPASAGKISILPNHVDTDIFRRIDAEKRYDLVYVGRLEAVKNLDALLSAVRRLGLSIALIGSGTARGHGSFANDEADRLQAKYGDLDGRIHWLGRIRNDELPLYINQAKVFALCSFTEGHPRALIEAMACAMPVIGTRVPGIQSVLQHGVTGYLCDTDADSIAGAIKTVLAQPELMRRLGENARKFAVENYSLPMLAQREYELLAEVARRCPVDGAARRLAQYVFRRR